MEWQTYLDNKLLATGAVTKALIVAIDGSTLAKSEGFDIDTHQIKVFLGNFNKVKLNLTPLITLGNQQFRHVPAPEPVISGQSGTAGIHFMKTAKSIVIGVYDEPITYDECRSAVEDFGNDIIAQGY